MKRLSFVIDDKIEKALTELGPRKNVGQFLRMVIHFYLDNHNSIESTQKELSEIKKKLDGKTFRAETIKNEDINQGNKTYNRSKAIENIMNMGKQQE